MLVFIPKYISVKFLFQFVSGVRQGGGCERVGRAQAASERVFIDALGAVLRPCLGLSVLCGVLGPH